MRAAPFLTLDAPPIAAADGARWPRLVERIEQGRGEVVEYDLAMPKWQFLSLLVRTSAVLLHGSDHPGIEEFRPRRPEDLDEFSGQLAVYAASDGVWPIYFAIVDRDRVRGLLNGCFRVLEPADGGEPPTSYFFSVDRPALAGRPWRDGTVYVLPRRTFVPQPPTRLRGHLVQVEQWASAEPVRPLARLPVAPADFPFLNAVVPHDPAVVRERAARDPDGFPWLDEPS